MENEIFCKMIITTYKLKDKTKTIYRVIESVTENITEKQYNNIVNSSPFFRRLGGSEYQEQGYTSRGYLTVKIISKSPERRFKTVRKFIFD